jgi:cysteine-rich repeat protein
MLHTLRRIPVRAIALAVAATVAAGATPARAARLLVRSQGLGVGVRSTVVVDAAVARGMASDRGRKVVEDLPLPDGTAASFDLEPVEVFSPAAKVVAFDGITERPIGRPDVAVYEGRERAGGDRTAIVAIVDGTHVWATVRKHGALLAVIHPRDGMPGEHAVVDPATEPAPNRSLCDGALAGPSGGNAGAPPPPGAPAPPPPSNATLAAEVLVDVGYDLYTDGFDSDETAASTYAANVFGAVSAIYRRDTNVVVLIKQLVVWIAPDPFGGADSSAQLTAYLNWNVANRGGVVRDVAHLLANVETAGGRAYLDALCQSDVGYGVSNIFANATSFPTTGYLWDIDVVSHELGHNFGSVHTHCYNPPLDHCYNTEAGCYSGPVEPSVGETMSYCHLVASIEMGFGSVVGPVIRAGAEAASCVTDPPGDCGDGVVDPGEQCDDGNTDDGDCCSGNCLVEGANVPCTSDGDVCTSDVCDAAGECIHVPPGLCSACGSPTIVPPGGGIINGATTSVPSTLAGSCGGAGAPEQVFQWTPTLSGPALIATCGTPHDTVLYVRDTYCDIGVERGCNDDSCGYQSRVAFPSVAGHTYFIVVDGYASEFGAFTLSVTPGTCGDGTLDPGEQCDDGNAASGDCCSATCAYESSSASCTDDADPCTSDVCDGAGTCRHDPPGTCNACSATTVIPPGGGTFMGMTSGSSTLTGSCGGGSAPERAYEWTPAVSGTWTLSLCGSAYDTVLYVRDASCTTDLACDDDSLCGTPSRIDFAATAGQTYVIVVDGYAANHGSYTLTVSPPVICGDGVIAGAEECDDANADPNDGCNDCRVCGNGVVSMPEECDDGNLVTTDGCSSACRFACPPTAVAGCRTPTQPGKSIVKLKKNAISSTKDVLAWKWSNGPVTTKAEFGSPLASDGYLFCLYDGAGLALTALAPPGDLCAGRPCWVSKPTGYSYKDKDLTPRGVLKLDLKQGLVAGKAKASLKGKGALLGLGNPGALTAPLRAQLLRPGGPCFEGVFSAPFIKQDSAQLKDVSD